MDDKWRDETLTQREAAIVKDVIGVVGDVLAEALRQRDERIAELESRTLADSFKGSWLPSTRYRRGELVQKGNSLWMALDATTEQPGHSPSWRQLAGAR